MAKLNTTTTAACNNTTQHRKLDVILWKKLRIGLSSRVGSLKVKEDTELGFQKGGYIRLNQINIPASPSVHKLQNDLILSTQTLGSLKYTLQ